MSKLLQMPHRCAEAMWTPSELTPRRRNGTFINGMALVAFLAALVFSGVCLYQKFLGAETAIVQQLK